MQLHMVEMQKVHEAQLEAQRQEFEVRGAALQERMQQIAAEVAAVKVESAKVEAKGTPSRLMRMRMRMMMRASQSQRDKLGKGPPTPNPPGGGGSGDDDPGTGPAVVVPMVPMTTKKTKEKEKFHVGQLPKQSQLVYWQDKLCVDGGNCSGRGRTGGDWIDKVRQPDCKFEELAYPRAETFLRMWIICSMLF